MVKNLPAMRETQVQSLGQEDPLEKGMVTHSSILAWRIPWTEEPGGPQSMGSQRVRRDWGTIKSICLQFGRPRFNPWVGKISWRRKWQPTPVFLPGESHGQGSPAGYSPWDPQESDTTEQFHFHFSLIKKIIFMGPIYLKKILIGTFIL